MNIAKHEDLYADSAGRFGLAFQAETGYFPQVLRQLRSAFWLSFILCGFFLGLPVQGEEEAAKPPLRVLSMPTEPFLYLNEKGEFQGLEYDLLRHFAKVQGRELVIEWADGFPSLLPRLAAGEIDLVSASLTITPERKAKFDFSSPYFPVLSLVVEVRGEESTSLEELRERRMLVVRGTSHDEALRAVGGIELVYDTNDASMFARLAAGEAIGLATDSPAYFWYADRYPNLGPSFSFGERSYYGFALRQGDPLKKDLDAFLEEIKHDGRFLGFLHEAFGPWGAEAIDAMAEGMFDGGS